VFAFKAAIQEHIKEKYLSIDETKLLKSSFESFKNEDKNEENSSNDLNNKKQDNLVSNQKEDINNNKILKESKINLDNK
jgi:hypothetical protein